MSSLRLILKQYRFELTIIVIGLLGASVVGMFVVLRLPDLLARLDACGGGFECTPLIEEAGRLGAVGAAIPGISSTFGVVGAVILGVAIVGREVERGTAALAWPLARSRRTWLLRRVVVVGVVLAIAALVPGLVSDRLLSAAMPGTDSATTFVGWELRGLLPVGRDLAAFGVAVLAGALFGRVLAGFLLAFVMVVAGLVGVSQINTAWRLADAISIDQGDPGSSVDLVIEVRLRDASGRYFTYQEVFEHMPEGEWPDGWPESVYQSVSLGIPGIRHPEIELRETGLLVVVAVLLAGASSIVVERRRPY